MKYRIRFAKYGLMRFVGHLDLMRFFQKALNRVEMPLSYSQGFHPHPLISFAAPLSVGVTSEGEYMDIVTEESVDEAAAIAALNEQMVDGMQIVGMTALSDKAKNAMAAVAAASYQVYFKDFAAANLPSTAQFEAGIRDFYENAEHITVVKQTKKSEREVDLKPLVYSFAVTSADELQEDSYVRYVLAEEAGQEGSGALPVFSMFLSCGSTDNIKPEFLMEHFLDAMGMKKEDYRLGIHRIDMFMKNEAGEFVSLGS